VITSSVSRTSPHFLHIRPSFFGEVAHQIAITEHRCEAGRRIRSLGKQHNPPLGARVPVFKPHQSAPAHSARGLRSPREIHRCRTRSTRDNRFRARSSSTIKSPVFNRNRTPNFRAAVQEHIAHPGLSRNSPRDPSFALDLHQRASVSSQSGTGASLWRLIRIRSHAAPIGFGGPPRSMCQPP
jgi:hypothetical protein